MTTITDRHRKAADRIFRLILDLRRQREEWEMLEAELDSEAVNPDVGAFSEDWWRRCSEQAILTDQVARIIAEEMEDQP